MDNLKKIVILRVVKKTTLFWCGYQKGWNANKRLAKLFVQERADKQSKIMEGN